jgi:predicted GH43/DUF377 family glycosyl hydrolase
MPRVRLPWNLLLLLPIACDVPHPLAWDAFTVHGPSPLVVDGTLRLYYYGLPSIQSTAPDLGLASAPCSDSTPGDPACRSPGPFDRSGQNPLKTTDGASLGQQGIASDPSVVRESRYRMWFTNVVLTTGNPAQLSTAYTESDDGVSWDVPTFNVLEPTPGTFDALGVETVSVVRTDASTLRLFYTGDSQPQGQGSDWHAIGTATSTDGTQWVKPGPNPVLDAQEDWEKGVCSDQACNVRTGGVGEPSVLYDTGAGQYHMWYAALGQVGGVGTYRIGYATSSDGLNWTRNADPVFEPGADGSWDAGGVSEPAVIPDPVVGFHLFYFGFSQGAVDQCSNAGGCSFTPGALGHAYSADGITWERDANPVLSPAS